MILWFELNDIVILILNNNTVHIGVQSVNNNMTKKINDDFFYYFLLHILTVLDIKKF